MSSALSATRSIALSYGTVVHPTPQTYFEPAHALGCRIINHLWSNWGQDECGLRDGEVDLYSVNIPLIEKILSEDGLTISWTRMWRNSYGRLFKPTSQSPSSKNHLVDPTGTHTSGPSAQEEARAPADVEIGDLLFKWGPEMKGLITPSPEALPVGSDGWAIYHGMVSVTPLRASFGEPYHNEPVNAEKIIWKMRL